MTPRDPRLLPWQLQGSFATGAQRSDRTLAVMVAPSKEGIWRVIALETDADASDIEAVFGSHSHGIVGTWTNAADAMTQAEQYALAWLDVNREPAPGCDCGEIDT